MIHGQPHLLEKAVGCVAKRNCSMAKFLVLALTLAVCRAGPVWISDENGYVPTYIFRVGRSPNMAFAFGSGFSSNIGGIGHSSSMGSSFQSGDAEAYSTGMAGSNGGRAFARGGGITYAAPIVYPTLNYQHSFASAVNNGIGRNTFGSAVSSAQNFGGNYRSAVSSAQTHNGLGGAATAQVQNGYATGYHTPARYQAVSSAQSVRGLGYDSAAAAVNSNEDLEYGTAVSSAQHLGDDFGSAVSSAQTNNGVHYRAAVSSAQNAGGFRGSSAQTVQQRGASVQQSGASSINGPGLQAAQSHAVNSGFY